MPNCATARPVHSRTKLRCDQSGSFCRNEGSREWRSSGDGAPGIDEDMTKYTPNDLGARCALRLHCPGALAVGYTALRSGQWQFFHTDVVRFPGLHHLVMRSVTGGSGTLAIHHRHYITTLQTSGIWWHDPCWKQGISDITWMTDGLHGRSLPDPTRLRMELMEV